jgi:membrane fusion protein (multidrug efflux system)
MGTLVTPGQTLLNTISSEDPMEVDIVINEKELERFRILSKSLPGKSDTTFRLKISDTSYYSRNGHIRIIDRAIDPQTGTIRVRLEFPNKEKNLTAGMSCKVNVLNNSMDEKVVIPSVSLMEQMSEYFVFVIDSMKARQTKVKLGTILDGKAIINEGLTEGQQIVSDGLQKLRNGVPVVVNKNSATD